MEIKTTMTTCPNGHHYDTAQHASCPYCGSPRFAPVQGGAFPPAGARGVGMFPPTEAPGAGRFPPTEAPGVGMFPPTEAPGVGMFPPTEAPGAGMFPPTEAPSGVVGGYAPGFVPTAPPPVPFRNSGDFSPHGVGAAAAGSDVDSSGAPEPVVGWAVCIEGPVRGRDFRILPGYNYIGREAGDIQLAGDMQVSGHNHAVLTFDSGELTFFISPAGGRDLIKVNEKTVLNATELKSYDVISIGSSKLIFVALCGDRFSWKAKEEANG